MVLESMNRCCSSIDRDAEGATSHGETFDRDLTAKDLNRGLTSIRRLYRGLALPIEGDVLDLRLYEDVLLTGPLHQKDIAVFEALQDRPYSASCTAIDVNRCSADARRCVEPKGNGNNEQQDSTLRSHCAMPVAR